MVIETVAPLLLGLDWLDPEQLLDRFGDYALWGAAAIVFAECGLLVGFFLPGDSLLFITGLAVTTGLIETPLWLVCLVLVVAAFAGNVCGFYIGRAAGPAIFDKPEYGVAPGQAAVRAGDPQPQPRGNTSNVDAWVTPSPWPPPRRIPSRNSSGSQPSQPRPSM